MHTYVYPRSIYSGRNIKNAFNFTQLCAGSTPKARGGATCVSGPLAYVYTCIYLHIHTRGNLKIYFCLCANVCRQHIECARRLHVCFEHSLALCALWLTVRPSRCVCHCLSVCLSTHRDLYVHTYKHANNHTYVLKTTPTNEYQ